MPAAKSYTVKADFSDAGGRKWRAGQTFDGTKEAIQAAVNAGQIEEQPADPNAPKE